MQSRHRERTTTSERPPIDLPDGREYDDEADAALDAALQEAIERADDADHDFLARLLRYQLGSLRYDRGRPK